MSIKESINNIPIDVCFVLDATKSTQNQFNGIIDNANDLSNNLISNLHQAAINFGGVIYRDPVDCMDPPPPPPPMPYYQESINLIHEQIMKERIHKLKESGLYDENFEIGIEERKQNYDRVKYPFNKNVTIPFKNNFEYLIDELMKVECGGGNDDPEDWVGALTLALNELDWRPESKKLIIWISDADAHGKRFCGYDNHNEEEHKLPPLIAKMAIDQICFVGINIIKYQEDDDYGCRKTLNEIKKIYEDAGGPCFVYDEFKPSINADEFYNNDVWPLY